MYQPHPPLARQRGAAILLAMVIVVLVTTLAAAMVWQQWRAVQVEAAERSRAQSRWILVGALDWARLILREDARNGGADHLGEVWAAPLAEARLSTFLATDKSNDEDGPEAFLSGSITDAQSRYNLSNLVKGGRIDPAELAVLKQLFENINVSSEVANTISKTLLSSAPPPAKRGNGPGNAPEGAPGNAAGNAAGNAPGNAAGNAAEGAPGDAVSAPEPVTDHPLIPQIPPHSVSQLAWFGLDAQTLRHIEPFVVLLPRPTPVNLNTAPREVLAAVIDGIDLGTAERLTQTRQRTPFTNLEDAQKVLPESAHLAPLRVTTQTEFFEVRGRLRLESQTVEERTLVRRVGRDVTTILRERINSVGP